MDTLCSDLLNLIRSVPITHAVLLGLNNDDNQKYLDIPLTMNRLKLAKIENNQQWILWCTGRLSTDDTISGLELNENVRNAIDDGLYTKCRESGINAHMAGLEYLLVNNANNNYVNAFVYGLSTAQHHKEFQSLISIDSIKMYMIITNLPNFNNEDFIISIIASLPGLSKNTPGYLFQDFCTKKRYTAIQYLVSNSLITPQDISGIALFELIKNDKLNILLECMNNRAILQKLRGESILLTMLKSNVNLIDELLKYRLISRKDIYPLTTKIRETYGLPNDYCSLERLIDEVGPLLFYEHSRFLSYLLSTLVNPSKCINNVIDTTLNFTVIHHLEHGSDLDTIKKILRSIYTYKNEQIDFIKEILKNCHWLNCSFISNCIKYFDYTIVELKYLAKRLCLKKCSTMKKDRLLFTIIMNTK